MKDFFKKNLKADKIISFLMIFSLLAVISYHLFSLYGISFVMKGKEIESVSGKDIETGLAKGVSISEGKVILNFWATWCGACVEELPLFVKASSSVKIIGVLQPPVNKSIINEYGLTYENVIGNEALLALFKINAFPTTFFIKDRKVEKVFVGKIDEKEISSWLAK